MRAGFNRTGFVVCAYLIQECGASVQGALDAFAAARPPGVKHEKFVVEVGPNLASLCHNMGCVRVPRTIPEVFSYLRHSVVRKRATLLAIIRADLALQNETERSSRGQPCSIASSIPC
jgi:hypothetical protein